jgi:hypothetical protein
MATVAGDENANAMTETAPRAYTPSWVDRFTAWVARLPGPSWSYYLGLALVLFLLQTAVLWAEGAFPTDSTVHRVHGFLAGAIGLFLALFHYLDRKAGASLAALRPAMKATEQEYHELHFQLTTLPAGSTLLAGLAALAISSLIETFGEHFHLEALNTFPVSGHVLRIVYLICWWVFGAFTYHAIHQLRLINRIYTQDTQINLFRMNPLYGLSNLAALTAGSLTMIPYGFLWANPSEDLLKDPIVLSFYLVITSLAVVTFIWPQLGIHRLQVAEKERLLYEATQRFEATITQLHQQVDSENLEGMMNLNMAMASLEMERNALGKIPTWPWEPEVVRLLITALALPLGLWVVQFILQRVLGS